MNGQQTTFLIEISQVCSDICWTLYSVGKPSEILLSYLWILQGGSLFQKVCITCSLQYKCFVNAAWSCPIEVVCWVDFFVIHGKVRRFTLLDSKNIHTTAQTISQLSSSCKKRCKWPVADHGRHNEEWRSAITVIPYTALTSMSSSSQTLHSW